ncbi:Ppx/GppA family phosphatase [Phocicoccus pinnipedialis]|uniref:Exopolyphosphatase n=1 Tax=Phocicoccus pinnipedialis TaxID=110845 RepID=A0A6V7RMT0_9BACL|nr:Ppx/GppA family phosphatase [Jeotgalicoccus pinnipedialis]MBP1939612.1 exopolyphosphatase/guanosine-5'-triphosphate,3'-diphosphate pyrophosphatase [Jeotgalicoccus pinnipedialis]CAD2078996.1 Exopolyphosphatase [Jeotgalicoccus pinnipedialis]
MKRFALLDIGSNTIRLVLFEYTSGEGLREIKNIKTPARLAQYLDNENVMEEAGILILLDILEGFKGIAERYNITEIHTAATAAVRASKNKIDIQKRVEEELKFPLRILSGEEEAYFGYKAVVHSIGHKDAITIDIGGGSTELTFYENKNLVYSTSLPFGVVTLKNKFFKDAHNNVEAIENTRQFVKNELKSVRWIKDRSVPIVAIGGSARNVARIHQAMISYPIAGVHGYSMQLKHLQKVNNLLMETPTDELDSIDGLSKDRSDLIIPSIIVFEELFEMVDATAFEFSRQGLREGMSMEIIKNDYPLAFNKFEVLEISLIELSNVFHVDRTSGKKRASLAEGIYHELFRHGFIDVKRKHKYLMMNAAKLYKLGDFIDSDAGSQHTFYLLSNFNILGLKHKDRVRLALLASYKNNSLLSFYMREIDWFTEEDQEQIRRMGSIIKFADSLNKSGTDTIVDVMISDKGERLDLIVRYQGDPVAEEYLAMRHLKHIEYITGKPIDLVFVECKD